MFHFKKKKIDWYNVKEHLKMLDDLQPELIKMFEVSDIPMQTKIQFNLNAMYKLKMKLIQMGQYIE